MRACIITALVPVALLAACGGTPEAPAARPIAIDSRVAYPSSAAYDPAARSLVVGSYSDGTVRRVPLRDARPSSEPPSLPQDGRLNVFRVRVDAGRGRIWVLAADAVYVYDSSTSRLVQRIAVGEASQHSNEHCLPDLALDGSGNAFVSSALRPRLFRIDAGSFEVTERALRPDADADKDFGLSALAFGADGTTLYAASATIGALWKIDYAQAAASKIALSQPVFGACALQVTGRARDGAEGLYVAGGFRGGIKRVDLDASSAPARVTALNVKGALAVPTDVVRADGRLLIVSSRLADHPDFDGPGTRLASFPILPMDTP